MMTSRGYCHPTFFEFVFLMAMVIFQEQKPDYVILETGLGGRLDTTNVIRRPLGCVITSISLEPVSYTHLAASKYYRRLYCRLLKLLYKKYEEKELLRCV